MDPIHPIIPESQTLPPIAPTPGVGRVDRRTPQRELAERRRREQRRREQLREHDGGELDVWDDEEPDVDGPAGLLGPGSPGPLVPPGGHIDLTA